MHPLHAVVDAGGEPWSRVRAVLERRRRQLPPGCRLELLTEDPGVRRSVREWCEAGGGELLAVDETDVPAVFRIRIAAATEQSRRNPEDG